MRHRKQVTPIFVKFWKNPNKIPSSIGSLAITEQYLELSDFFWVSQKTFLQLMSDFTKTHVTFGHQCIKGKFPQAGGGE